MAHKRYLAELIGTYLLVFAGTAAIVIDDVSGGAISHFGVATVFGLVVAALIYTLGDISGAHLNPAVTVAFWVARRFPGREVPAYILSQCLGAILASTTVKLLFIAHPSLGETVPAGSVSQSLVLEILLTFFLMLTIINVATGAKEKGMIAGFAIGAVVGLEALFAGPISGASMNPARSLGPALLSGHLTYLWVYLSAPIIGAYLAILCCRCLREKECCR